MLLDRGDGPEKGGAGGNYCGIGFRCRRILCGIGVDRIVVLLLVLFFIYGKNVFFSSFV